MTREGQEKSLERKAWWKKAKKREAAFKSGASKRAVAEGPRKVAGHHAELVKERRIAQWIKKNPNANFIPISVITGAKKPTPYPSSKGGKLKHGGKAKKKYGVVGKLTLRKGGKV